MKSFIFPSRLSQIWIMHLTSLTRQLWELRSLCIISQLCRYAMPEAISLAKLIRWSQGRGSSRAWMISLRVPPEMYSVSKCSLRSLYKTPMNRRTFLWLRLLKTATWNEKRKHMNISIYQIMNFFFLCPIPLSPWQCKVYLYISILNIHIYETLLTSLRKFACACSSTLYSSFKTITSPVSEWVILYTWNVPYITVFYLFIIITCLFTISPCLKCMQDLVLNSPLLTYRI